MAAGSQTTATREPDQLHGQQQLGQERAAAYSVSGSRWCLTDCTISGNSPRLQEAASRTALAARRLNDTIVALNNEPPAPARRPAISPVQPTSSGGFNLIGIGGSGGLMNGVLGNIVGVTDPDLGSLGPYGGPTQTMALLPGSPAIGKGVPTGGISTDQRGLTRGGLVDIGAYQTSLLVESTFGFTRTDPDRLTLAGAVSLANSFAGPVAINFDPEVFTGGQTITLSEGQLELNAPIPIITITGPTAGVTISGGGASRVFQIDKSVTAFISGLTISDGPGSTAPASRILARRH